VARTVGNRHRTSARVDDVDSTAQLSGALTEAAAGHGLGASLSRRAVHDRMEADAQPAVVAPDDVLVMASGNLGLVYVTGRERRSTREELDESCPGLVETLAAHPGVGFVVVATESGDVAIGADGAVRIADGMVEGVDPTTPYGPNTLRHLRRHVRFRHMPDLLVVGAWYEELGEVAAFEELIGSHGGLGGEQSHAFVLAPARLRWPDVDGGIVGAAAVHRILRGWLAREHERVRGAA
jgi:hypothetical protein